MISKKGLSNEIDSLRALVRMNEREQERTSANLIQLENLVEELVKELGYRVTYKEGLYLEPIEEDSDE